MPAIIALMFFIIIGVLGVGGWIANIFKIFGLWNDPVTTELVIRIFGVPMAFIGAIAGYF